MAAKNYPDVILNTPHNARILARLFSYKARVYDLNEYEAIVPGAGRRIWESFVKEEEHLKKMDALRAKPGNRVGIQRGPFDIFRVFRI